MTLHTRPEPDHNGWTAFETWRYHPGHPLHASGWWWSAVNEDNDHVGLNHGPFPTEAAAAADAQEQS